MKAILLKLATPRLPGPPPTGLLVDGFMELKFPIILVATSGAALTGENKRFDFKRRAWRCGITLVLVGVGIGAAFGVVGARAADSAHQTETNFISPIITEEVLPDEPGEFTLRLGTDYGHRNGSANALPYAEACFGLIERFGATVNVPMAYHDEGAEASYGLGDISAILKYLAVRHSPSIPAVVLGLETQFPTGNQHLGLGTGAYELTPYVALLKDFGPLLVQGNVGWSKQVTGNREDAWVYNWAASVPVYRRKLYLLTEINGDWGRPNHAAISPGIKYLFSEKFSVGVAAPIGLNRNSEAWGTVTQFQIEF
jgi:hypothetical protein